MVCIFDHTCTAGKKGKPVANMVSVFLILLYVVGCRACRELWALDLRAEAVFFADLGGPRR